jgi:putative Mg2+ transporter-C (MgtC) family protein
MPEWLTTLTDWSLVARHLRDLVLAYLLAIPIALDREARERTAGLRTFPLVALASCAYVLLGFSILDSTEAEARVVQGLITGIGFIGGGAILKRGDDVTGTATATSLWATGAIGLACATQRYEVAIIIGVVTLFTLRMLKSLMSHASDKVGSDAKDDGD